MDNPPTQASLKKALQQLSTWNPKLIDTRPDSSEEANPRGRPRVRYFVTPAVLTTIEFDQAWIICRLVEHGPQFLETVHAWFKDDFPHLSDWEQFSTLVKAAVKRGYLTLDTDNQICSPTKRAIQEQLYICAIADFFMRSKHSLTPKKPK
jgi:hypothetical protein